MEQYVGLDVSLKLTAICIVDRTGKIEREGVVTSDPETIAAFVRSHAPHVARVGLEAGATSTWLWTELNKMGLPVICIDARHAKAVLKMQINKSDRNDAVGIARIMQCGWYKEIRVKDLDSHATKALLVSRALLVKIRRDIENQIRGLLKNLGLVIGRAKMNVFATRAAELAEARPELAAAVEPLLKAREAVGRQIADLDRKVMRLARNDAQVRRFMTAPGVGSITALCFLATIDDPTRFKRSRSVGAYVGLTTRRYASGEIDWTGRISKCGDAMLRSYLYEAANVLLTRVARWSTLKAWGIRIAKRSGLRKAKVAVARKLAVIAKPRAISPTPASRQGRSFPLVGRNSVVLLSRFVTNGLLLRHSPRRETASKIVGLRRPQLLPRLRLRHAFSSRVTASAGIGISSENSGRARSFSTTH